MKNFKLFLLSLVALIGLTSCEEELEPQNTNYVTFENDRTLEVTPDGTSSFDVMVYSANVVGNDRTFNVNVSDASTADPSSYTIGSSVTIPANSNVGKISLSVTDTDLDLANAKTLILNLSEQNGLSLGDGITLNLLEQCLFNLVNLNITFDGYSEETQWGIFDAATGNLLASNSYAAGVSSTSEQFCFEDGDYIFLILDSYGDGLSFPEDGTVSLTSNGTVLVEVSGNFGDQYQEGFTLGN